ncbi:hypothetical protein BX666DRAFT_1092521 [Dichotomocladium elegans]|nr:hypothetical protein BX666DRAFT_1092521 [Dichotomocladium elegans]
MATTTTTTTDTVKKQFAVDLASSHPLALSDEGAQRNNRLLRRRKSMMSVAEGAKSRLSHIPQQHRPSDSSSSDETLDPKSSTRRQSLTRATVSSMAKVVPNEIKRRNSMMNLSSTTSTHNPFAPPPQSTGSMSILKNSSLLTGDITTITPPPRRASLLHPPNRRSTMPVLSVPPPSLPRPPSKLQQSGVLGSRPAPLLNSRILESSQGSLRRRASVQNFENVITAAAVAVAEPDTNKPMRCRHAANNKDVHQPIWLRRQTKCEACNPNPIPQPPSPPPQQQQQQQQQQLSPTLPRTISPPPTVAATAAAAMAAAAAVVSAAAATAASSGPTLDQQNPKWADLINHCVAHSSRLEKLAQEILGQESKTNRVVSRQTSLEDLQQTREEAHQEKIKECESLVKAQRSMLLELEALLAEFGVAETSTSTSSNGSSSAPAQQGKEQERLGETSLSTPPPSSPSVSSSLPSMPPSPTTSSENGFDKNRKAIVASPEPLTQPQERTTAPRSPISPSNVDWTQKVDESVSRFRWTVSQWVGGLVGNGQCVRDDGQSMVVSGTAFTKEPNLLPLHLTTSASSQSDSVHYHQYVLEIKPDDRNTRLALLPSTQWTPDANVNFCEFSYADNKEGKCSTEFNWAVRRHHCRKCGHVFCNAHSSNRLPLFSSAGRSEKPEWSRVCDSCFYNVAGSSLFHPADQPSS